MTSILLLKLIDVRHSRGPNPLDAYRCQHQVKVRREHYHQCYYFSSLVRRKQMPVLHHLQARNSVRLARGTCEYSLPIVLYLSYLQNFHLDVKRETPKMETFNAPL